MSDPGGGGSTISGRKKKEGNGAGSQKEESVRGKRVATIRTQVNSGTFRVEPDAVASKMVDDAVKKIRSRIRPQ